MPTKRQSGRISWGERIMPERLSYMIENMRQLALPVLAIAAVLGVLLWLVRKRGNIALAVYTLMAIVLSAFLFFLMDYTVEELVRHMPDYIKTSGLENEWELTLGKIQMGLGILNFLVAIVCPAGFFITLGKKNRRLWCIPFAVVYLLNMFWCFAFTWL